MRTFLLGWTHGNESSYSEVHAGSPVDAFRVLRGLLPVFLPSVLYLAASHWGWV